jgi:hypothetical protein
MKIPSILVVLLLIETSLVFADDPLQSEPLSASDINADAAAAATTGAEDDEDEDGDGRGEMSSELRHRRTRVALPLASSSSSKEDQDNPIHHHRFQQLHHQPHERNVNANFREAAGEAGERERWVLDSESSSPEALDTAGGVPEQYASQEANPVAGASASSTTTVGAKDVKRLWGAGTAAATATSPSLTGGGPAADASIATGTTASGGELPPEGGLPGGSGDEPNKTRAFLVPKGKLAGGKGPPDGYALSARVYIDPRDKLAHFDSAVQIPFWDCGHSGSTTSPLALKSAYFRHSLTGATSWSGTDGKHAVLVVALSPLIMDLNSGESREFGAGSVILLEDVLIAGHRMRPLGNTKEGVSVLFLTLPQQFAHSGRDHISLPASFLRPAHRDDPCPNEHPWDEDVRGSGFDVSNSTVVSPKNEVYVDGSSGDPLATIEELGSSDTVPSHWTPRRLRRGLLAVFGLSLSSLAADFLAKTAPLWLAVGVGGTCFVAACTWAVAAGGDALWMAVELHLERRKLGATSGDASLVLEDDDEPADTLQ